MTASSALPVQNHDRIWAKTPRFDPTLLSAWTPVGTKHATHTEKNILPPYAVHSAGIRIFAADL